MVRVFSPLPPKQAILYELTPVCSQVPVLNDVRDITLVETPKNELVALISCENKAPPQLWKLEIVRSGEFGREHSRLTLRYATAFFSILLRILMAFSGLPLDIHICPKLLLILRDQATLAGVIWN
jgi:hypothetical protein